MDLNASKPTNFRKFFSDDEINGFREIFSMYDKDNSGTITLNEIGEVMKSAGLNPSDEEIKQMILEMDSNDSGTIEFSEFLAIIKSRIQNSEYNGFKEIFLKHDINESGLINKEELLSVIHTYNKRFSEDDVENLIKEVGHTNNYVNYEDFLKAWRAL
ncbi:neo-calmodulin [Hydra vulgaris]|uniref:neo-calmodulin n=1 Tax=Hydra vulgaris TaxID=6087 RepID=UPI0001924F7E|nr:neo-calmodulin [Hydra vulgaris]